MHSFRYVTTAKPMPGVRVVMAHPEDSRYIRQCGRVRCSERLSRWTWLVVADIDHAPGTEDRLTTGCGVALVAPLDRSEVSLPP